MRGGWWVTENGGKIDLPQACHAPLHIPLATCFPLSTLEREVLLSLASSGRISFDASDLRIPN